MPIPIGYHYAEANNGTKLKIPLYNPLDVDNSYVRLKLSEGTIGCYDLIPPSNLTKVRVMTRHGVFGVNLNIKNENELPLEIEWIEVNSLGDTSLTLNWSPVSNALNYDIEKNGVYVTTTAATSYKISSLSPSTEYTFTVKAKNGSGESNGKEIIINTLATRGLIFNLDFTNKKDSISNVLYDTVNGVSCKIFNVSHDGINDGFIDNKGLLVTANGYVEVPSNVGLLHDSIDWSLGVTFECVVYNSFGVLFRTSGGELRSYISNATNNNNIKYVSTNSTEKIINQGITWFKDPNGITSDKNVVDSLNPKTELNVITARINPNGVFDLFVNGWKGLNTTTIADFSHLYDMLGISPLYIRRNQVGINTDSTTLNSFSIYNKMLTDTEIIERYRQIKQDEPLDTVKVYPTDVELEIGENRLLAIVAVPTSYTPLLNNDYDSGNDGYVTIDGNGLMTGVNNGNTEISVTSSYNGQTFINYVPVNVGNSSTPPPLSTRVVNGVSINRKVQELEVGHSFLAMATTMPFDVFNDNLIVWESSNPSVCNVNYGVLQGISTGTATVTAYDSTKSYSSSFEVNVIESLDINISEEKTYFVSASTHGIRLDNTDSINTTRGIQAAMDYAAANGYKKIVFPIGMYLISPTQGTIYPPTNMIIDFNNSIINIEASSLTSSGYYMFYFKDVNYTKIMNAHIFGEAQYVSVSGSFEGCITVLIANAYRSGLENCTISKSPGFNIATHAQRGVDQPGRHPSKDNWQAGSIDPNTGLNDDTNTSYHFRSINYLNVSLLGEHYHLGYTQGYFGYPYLRSRLYSIYFYDSNHNFIESSMYNLQFYNYLKPQNAYYAKIVIYQDVAPTSHDSDFNAVAMLRTFYIPTECYIRNCTIEDNYSCGLAMTGGQGWIVEGNTFSRNGKRMPSCDIDWEDGWEASVGDICRNNKFNSPSGVIVSGVSNIALYDNVFTNSHLNIWPRTANWKAYNNFFDGKGNNRNLSLGCQAESYFEKNILRGVSYPSSPEKYHAGASYAVRLKNNTIL